MQNPVMARFQENDPKPLRDTPWAVIRQPAKDGTSAEYRTRQEIKNKFNKCCIIVNALPAQICFRTRRNEVHPTMSISPSN